MLFLLSDQEQTLTNHDVGCARMSLRLGAVAGFPTFGTGDIVFSVFLLRVPNATLCFIKNRFKNTKTVPQEKDLP